MVLLAKVWSGNTALDNLTPFNSIPFKNRALLLTWKCSISLTVWRDANKTIPGARTADCKNKCLKAPTVEEVDVLQFSLYFFPPSLLSDFCFSLFSSAGGFWSLCEWQVWAFALRKGYRHFQTAKFTSGGDIRQNDTLAHTVNQHNRSNSQQEFSLLFLFLIYQFAAAAVFLFSSFLIFKPRLKMLLSCEKPSCDHKCC